MPGPVPPRKLSVQPYARMGNLGGTRHGLDIQLAAGLEDKAGPRRLAAIRNWCSSNPVGNAAKVKLSHAQDCSDCGVEFADARARDALLKALPGLIGEIDLAKPRTRQAEGWLGGDLDLSVRLLAAADEDSTEQIEISLDDAVSSPARAAFFQQLVAACAKMKLPLTRSGRRSARLAAEDGKLPQKLADWLANTQIPRQLDQPEETPPKADRRQPMTPETPALPTVNWTVREYRGTLGGQSFCIELYVGVGEPEEELTRRKQVLAKYLKANSITVLGEVEGMDGPLSVFNLTNRADVETMTRALPKIMGLPATEVNGAFDKLQPYAGHLDVPAGMTMVTDDTLKLNDQKGKGLVIGLPKDMPETLVKATRARLVRSTEPGAVYQMAKDSNSLRLVFPDADARQSYADKALQVLNALPKPKPKTPPTP